jgi:hypothetical protein
VFSRGAGVPAVTQPEVSTHLSAQGTLVLKTIFVLDTCFLLFHKLLVQVTLLLPAESRLMNRRIYGGVEYESQ